MRGQSSSTTRCPSTAQGCWSVSSFSRASLLLKRLGFEDSDSDSDGSASANTAAALAAQRLAPGSSDSDSIWVRSAMTRRPSLPALPFLQFFPTQTLYLD